MRRFWQRNNALKIIIAILLIAMLSFLIVKFFLKEEVVIVENRTILVNGTDQIAEEETEETKIDNSFISVDAKEAYVIGRYGNNMQWDGKIVRGVDGEAVVKIDKENNLANVRAEVNGTFYPHERSRLNGTLRIEFYSYEGFEEYMEDGVIYNTELFGDTEKGQSYLPITYAHVAGWGKANVFLNDQVLYSDLLGQFMINKGIRKPDGSVKADNVVYNQDAKSDKSFMDDDTEVTFMVYSLESDDKNFPTREVFLHLVFEDVDVKSTIKEIKI